MTARPWRVREHVVTHWPAAWFRRRHWAGCTLPIPLFGPVVLYWGEPTPEKRRHELRHVRQMAEMGCVRWAIAYAWQLVTVGYRNSAIEREAYAAELEE